MAAWARENRLRLLDVETGVPRRLDGMYYPTQLIGGLVEGSAFEVAFRPHPVPLPILKRPF